MSQITATDPTLSASNGDVAASRADLVRQSDLGRQALSALSIISWFYLFAIGFLLAWVLTVSLLLGWEPTVITTGSMRPSIRPGDVVLQRPPADEQLSVGTVITFEDPIRPGERVTHRIEEVKSGGVYVTRGDANGAADSVTVEQGDVVGVGRLLVPLIGLPIEWRQDGRWHLLAGWLGVTAVAVALAAWSPRRRRS